MKAHMYLDIIKDSAKRKQEKYEKMRFTNEVIFESWVIAACDQLKTRIGADFELSRQHAMWISEQMEIVRKTTWAAGRTKVIEDILLMMAPVPTDRRQ